METDGGCRFLRKYLIRFQRHGDGLIREKRKYGGAARVRRSFLLLKMRNGKQKPTTGFCLKCKFFRRSFGHVYKSLSKVLILFIHYCIILSLNISAERSAVRKGTKQLCNTRPTRSEIYVFWDTAETESPRLRKRCFILRAAPTDSARRHREIPFPTSIPKKSKDRFQSRLR